jgi:guanosine-3',5'-bis(diphosphate) 3'-pyrophosphohydrolase
MYPLQSHYQEAIKFATYKHLEKKQKVKGTKLPYVVHLSNVAMEILAASDKTPDFDLDYALQVSLLHDTIEDTDTTLDEIEERFGAGIADGVLAMTKNIKLPREMQIPDSLVRIKKMRKEVWAVKLADRIANLQAPPFKWHKEKIRKYQEESRLIHDALKDGNKYLAKRLNDVIIDYDKYLL